MMIRYHVHFERCQIPFRMAFPLDDMLSLPQIVWPVERSHSQGCSAGRTERWLKEIDGGSASRAVSF
jgi:hypothetical protein